MKTSFDTSIGATSTSGGSEKSSNALMYLLIAGLAIYVGYKYVYLPYEAKKKLETDEKK